MSGKRSRNKGAAFEREVAKMFREIGIPAERCLTETRDGNVGDLIGSAPFTVQCKVGARPPVWQALKEAIEAAPDHRTPVAILRRNGCGGRPAEDVAVLPLERFFAMVAVIQSFNDVADAFESLETEGAT